MSGRYYDPPESMRLYSVKETLALNSRATQYRTDEPACPGIQSWWLDWSFWIMVRYSVKHKEGGLDLVLLATDGRSLLSTTKSLPFPRTATLPPSEEMKIVIWSRWSCKFSSNRICQIPSFHSLSEHRIPYIHPNAKLASFQRQLWKLNSMTEWLLKSTNSEIKNKLLLKQDHRFDESWSVREPKGHWWTFNSSFQSTASWNDWLYPGGLSPFKCNVTNAHNDFSPHAAWESDNSGKVGKRTYPALFSGSD